MKSTIQFLTEETLSINNPFFDYGGEFYQKFFLPYYKETSADVSNNYEYFPQYGTEHFRWMLGDYREYIETNYDQETADEILKDFDDYSAYDGSTEPEEYIQFRDRWSEENVEEYLEGLADDAYRIVGDLRYMIKHNGGMVDIWRAMTVPDNYTNHLETQGKSLGIYWSWDEEAPDTHWGMKNRTTKIGNKISLPNTVIIHSEVREEFVNWRQTIFANGHPTLSDEKEITLFKGTPLKILDITDKKRNPIEISDTIENKTFYA